MLCRSVSASYTNEKLLDSAGNVTGYTGDYEKGNLPTRFTMYPDRVVNYEYDRLDRITSRCFVNSGVPVYNSYQYYVRQNAPSESNVVYRTTQLLREIVDNTGYTYTYDDVGNILTVKTSQRLYPNTSKVEIGEHSDYRSYSYDNKYQLTRENNVTSGKTTVYSYDGLGNITSKTEYPYTQGALGTALSTVNYTYSNDGKNGWNKLLTAVGNETVTYDAIGNPTSYLGASLSWFGRKLQSYEKGNTSVTYTYDAGGSRASKTVNGTKNEFVYLDGKLVYEKRGGDDIFYLYDSYGSLSNIRWYKSGASSPTNIYVITNRQGDVLGLYDYAGTRKVSYEYDAWGNTVSVTDTSEDCWSTLNPFRYRGYYFDTETGLYYLLSRYYDPAVGRFLNADGYISTGTGITGLNMFAYCGNNPVTRADYTGMFWKEIGDFFSKAWSGIKTWANNTFGGSISNTKTIYDDNDEISKVPWFVSIKYGAKSVQTVSKQGDSSKPVSVYASNNIESPILSSAGIILNCSDGFAIKSTVGFDDISLSYSGTSGNTTNSFAIKLNASELKLGLECATAIQWDNTTDTTYTNVSINAFTILAAYAYVTTGDPAVLPQPAYS